MRHAPAPEKETVPAVEGWVAEIEEARAEFDQTPVKPILHEPDPEKFDLGPTFEEERHVRENLADQQEAAIIQHLFEQNIRLQEQLENAREKENEPHSYIE